MELKILQWNVWYKEDPKNILSVLKELDADILCLQELTEHSESNPHTNIPALLSSELGLTRAFYIAQEWKTDNGLIRNQGNGIFSKYQIRSSERKVVQQSGGSNPDFDDEERIYIEAEIDIGGVPLTVATTHLSYTHEFAGSAKRDAENMKVVEYVGRNRQHYIFAGDLNAPPRTFIVDALPRESDLLIASPSYDKNTWTTKPFSYKGFTVNSLEYRLDYVFCSRDITVIDTKVVYTDASDHLPILTTIKA